MQLAPKDRLDAESAIRSSLIQYLGGGILLAGLYFTARSIRLTWEGHITDRYAKAIEQLGTSNADVRIGGIYALERLARDSRVDHVTVVEVLTSHRHIERPLKQDNTTPAPCSASGDRHPTGLCQ
jgi:hypothetical protein